jgi:peptide/nickel transport system ATP-binding protein
MTTPLLQLDEVTRRYALPREHLWKPPAQVQALRGVSLSLHAGRHLGVVGESGSGKSTLARLAMALEAPNSGSVRLLGQDLHQLSPAALRAARRDFQMVFQDPYGSLDPRQTVERIVTEALTMLERLSRAELRARASAVLDSVGLRHSDLDKYPHEFSGGQRQRVAIARALITRPKLIVADEPVSALDVSIQAQVLNLMQDLSEQFGVSYLLISHDLAVVEHLCEDIAVIYQGRIVEQGPAQSLLRQPLHPYTRALIEAVPSMAPATRVRARRVTPIVRALAPAACPYAARCPQAFELCEAQRPELLPTAGEHRVACHVRASDATGY